MGGWAGGVQGDKQVCIARLDGEGNRESCVFTINIEAIILIRACADTLSRQRRARHQRDQRLFQRSRDGKVAIRSRREHSDEKDTGRAEVRVGG